MSESRTAILSIAGFDPTAGAGILADAAVFRALGFHPLTVLTSVAAQGTSGVTRIQPLSGAFIRQELEIIAGQWHAAALKIGMVYSPAAVRAIGSFLKREKIPAVLDPVLKASQGGDLLLPSALPLLESCLIPRCQLVTPNTEEAGFFLGRKICQREEAISAAWELSQRWKTAVLLKGGHLPAEPYDIFVQGNKREEFLHPRILPGKILRGTGCVLTAIITACLARGMKLTAAVRTGIKLLEVSINKAYTCGANQKIAYLDFPFKPL